MNNFYGVMNVEETTLLAYPWTRHLKVLNMGYD